MSTIPQTGATTPPPAKLSTLEWIMAVVMFVVGLLLVVGGLWLFGDAEPSDEGDNPFAFKSKEKVVEEPVAVGDATGSKTTTETDYSDGVMIFVLTVGGGLMLAGSFYPRIKEISLGTFGLKLVDSSPAQDQAGKKAEAEAVEKVKASDAIPNEQADAVATAAKAIAQKDVANYVLRGATLGELPLELIAENAADQAVREVS